MIINDEKYDYNDYGSYIDSYFEDYPDDCDDEIEKIEKIKSDIDKLVKAYEFKEEYWECKPYCRHNHEPYYDEKGNLVRKNEYFYDYYVGIKVILFNLFKGMFSNPPRGLFMDFKEDRDKYNMSPYERLKIEGFENLNAITFKGTKVSGGYYTGDIDDLHYVERFYTSYTETFYINRDDIEDPYVRRVYTIHGPQEHINGGKRGD